MYENLVEWKNSPHRKPLILEGARQVGKTWLIDEFGPKEFKYYIKINCENNPEVSDLFSDYDIKRILRVISALAKKPVKPHGNQFSKKGCLKFQIYVNIKTWVGKN